MYSKTHNFFKTFEEFQGLLIFCEKSCIFLKKSAFEYFSKENYINFPIL